MAKDKSKESKKTEERKPITEDSRFASVHNDPRFKFPNLNKLKVKVDDRFSKKELKKLNNSKKASIDRYGRKIKEKDSGLDKFYEEEEEDDEEEEEETEDKKSDDEESDSESDSGSDSETTLTSALDRARGEGGESESEESDSESSESESEVEIEEESEIEIEDTKPEEGDPSDTFAVVNMDWDNLRAVDLMATFISFVPKGGLIKSITIYPSEFGKEQMQKEETEGPSRDLFKKKSKKVESDDEDEDFDTTNAADLERAAKKLYEEGDGEEDYDSKALRRYQLQRLRYYYAVVKCDSISTAQSIYKNCDGTEYESTANIFDLRYVPEGMEFDDSEAKDQCFKIPTNYKPNTLFVTDALQHSKVKLTWDETPKERLAVANRAFSQKEIDEMDFKAYLASGSEDEGEDDSAKDKYKNLLGGVSFGSKKDEDEEDEVDMEITFDPGLQAPEPVENDEEEEEDTLSAYKRRQKERRKARLEKFKQEKQGKEPEPKKEKKDKKSKKAKAPIDEKAQAELELLMMNEDGEKEDNHFDMKDIIKSEKKKGKKGKKTEEVQDNFEVDLNDDRFKEIFENRDYNIDPSNTDFKKTKTMKKILDERSKRQHKGKSDQPKKKVKTNDLNNLVDKIKRKHKH